MKIRGWLCAAALGTLVIGCADPAACASARSVNEQIEAAAQADSIPTAGLCQLNKSQIVELLVTMGVHDPANAPNRADQYIGACQRLIELKLECGD